jgi:hypothetical protein
MFTFFSCVKKVSKEKSFLPVYLIIVQINSFRNIYKFPIETESSNEREKMAPPTIA